MDNETSTGNILYEVRKELHENNTETILKGVIECD